MVIARKHLKSEDWKKRTALYEIRGDLEGGRITGFAGQTDSWRATLDLSRLSQG